MQKYLMAGTAAFAVASILCAVLSVRALRRRSWISAAGGTTVGLLFLSLSALAATLAISTNGYRLLTHEEVAVTVTTVPTGPSAFQAFVEFPDGRDTTLAVLGDQLEVDAHILKWRYVANLFGLHTQYELDRLNGRYIDIEDERTKGRTVHSLKTSKPIDLFSLAENHPLFGMLVDAEYGSATYIEVRRPARFQVTVSTTGLLVREIELRDRATPEERRQT